MWPFTGYHVKHKLTHSLMGAINAPGTLYTMCRNVEYRIVLPLELMPFVVFAGKHVKHKLTHPLMDAINTLGVLNTMYRDVEYGTYSLWN